jgi:hypothetical protein
MDSKAPRISHVEVKARYEYDPLTGIVTDKTTGRSVGARMPDGYTVMNLRGKMIGVHRLAFFWMRGYWPPEQIDHVNGARSDNRWCNLRLASATENAQNKTPYGVKNHGFKGTKLDANGKWRAQITVDGKVKYIPGRYNSAAEAHRAYKHWAGQHFGQFSRTIAPIMGVRVHQNDAKAAAEQLREMMARRSRVAAQLKELDEGIESLQRQLKRRGIEVAPDELVEPKKEPAPLASELKARLEVMRRLDQERPIQQ